RIASTVSRRGHVESLRNKTALQELADRRCPVRHPLCKTPIVQSLYFRERQNERHSLTRTFAHQRALAVLRTAILRHNKYLPGRWGHRWTSGVIVGRSERRGHNHLVRRSPTNRFHLRPFIL